jgi:flotillin
MPTVFTVGPMDNLDTLKSYSKLLQSSSPEDLKAKIIGIIQGETRVACGKIKLDDLFNNRETFKKELVDNVDEELKQFGLKVYNANIEELRDMEGNEYFVFLRKRALEGAVNNAKVAVAEQNKIGNVGEKEHLTETRQKLAEFEKQAKLTENERDREILQSNTDLSVASADLTKKKAIAEAEGKASADIRTLELQKEVEVIRNKQEIERLRASEFSVASVAAEIAIKKSEGIANALKLEAEGKASALTTEARAKAEATKLQAEADAEAMKLKAQAYYIEKSNEAKGILELRQAEASGLQKLIESAGGVGGLVDYLIIKDGLLHQIAKEQSSAVQGMKPNITVWNTNGTGGSSDLSKTFADLVKTGVPLLENVKNVSGLDLLKSFKKDDLPPKNNQV